MDEHMMTVMSQMQHVLEMQMVQAQQMQNMEQQQTTLRDGQANISTQLEVFKCTKPNVPDASPTVTSFPVKMSPPKRPRGKKTP